MNLLHYAKWRLSRFRSTPIQGYFCGGGIQHNDWVQMSNEQMYIAKATDHPDLFTLVRVRWYHRLAAWLWHTPNRLRFWT